jgi:arylsulfatase A-like enzyme
MRLKLLVRRLCLLFALAFRLLDVAASPAAQPNLLVIVADDLGYADVGFNGGHLIDTPNLDRLAATGLNLTDFHTCPMCSPTRAGLLTGRWPLRFGLMRAVVPPWSPHGLPAAEHTLPELLAAAGYAERGIVGKWHLGQARREYLPTAHGFTHFYGHYNGAIDYFTHQREGECDWHRNNLTIHENGYATDLLAEEAIRFISDAPPGRPWFLYVPFNAPHAPYQAKPNDLEKYKHLEGHQRRAYAAMVDSLDQAVGRILAAVEGRPGAADTLVLFFSDNGGIPKVGSSNAPYRGAKLTVYEGGTRVCAAIRWPAGGLAGGQRFDGRIGYIDVLPTLLAAAGAPPPPDVDGIDLLPALRGEAPLPRRAWFSYVHQNDDAHAAVHLGPWKLVAHGDFIADHPANPPALELYNLSSDLGETTDLASERPSLVAELYGRLREFGAWQKPRLGPYSEGRSGFVAPKDWLITH